MHFAQAAQLGFMRTAALELCNKVSQPPLLVAPPTPLPLTSHQGITVNAVLPGNITTEGARPASRHFFELASCAGNTS
jgi:hypothetical protein